MEPAVSAETIERLLRPHILGDTVVPSEMYGQLATYLELLLKWNARTNLTAIREPTEIVRRHFGESLFAAQHFDSFDGSCKTLLDFGSGAGFPGLPIQLLRPELKVTLAESQNKKATFLREAVRKLGLGTEVWAGRVESMPPGRRFDTVAMRAVDDMRTALAAAAARASSKLIILSTDRHGWHLPDGFDLEATVAMAESDSQQILILKRQPVAV